MLAAAQGALYAWYEIAGIILAIPVAIALVWGIVKIIHTIVSRLSVVNEAVAGREEKRVNGVMVAEHIPSMIERFKDVNSHLARQDTALGAIKAELTYNGGGSTKDQIATLHRKVDALTRGQRAAAQTAVNVSAELHSD